MSYGRGMEPPFVLVDVDGVLNPFRRPDKTFHRHRASPDGQTFNLWLTVRHGRMLRDLAAETGAGLVWASYWCDQANEWIAPRVGLPQMPFVPIPPRPHDTGLSLGGWKVRHVVDWAAGRPFVWFEDEPDATDLLNAEPGRGPCLLVPVDPMCGLTPDDVDQARTWLEALDPVR